jgi:hypothetical protein
MLFGFSVGDFLAVINLICDITNSVRATGGARSEYQELIRDLETLKKALKHIQENYEQTTTINSINYAVLSCRLPLENFLNKFCKCGEFSDTLAKNSDIHTAAAKLMWTFSYKEEIKKLQSYLNPHVSVIDTLLTVYGVDKMATIVQTFLRSRSSSVASFP